MKTENVIVESRPMALHDNTILDVSAVAKCIKVGFRKGFRSWENYCVVMIAYGNEKF